MKKPPSEGGFLLRADLAVIYANYHEIRFKYVNDTHPKSDACGRISDAQ
jgi:hypothetical protein